jgi:CDP-paratose 2-epimerase
MRKYQLMQVASQVFGVSVLSGKTVQWEYVAKNRKGDHICYISDLTKMRQHYPEWNTTKSLDDIFWEIYEATQRRGSSRREPVLF